MGIYPEKTVTERDACTSEFAAASFTVARTWTQPRCPLTDEWIQRSWDIHTMDYYSAVKRNAFESVLMRWMNLEPIVQIKISQKDKYCILMHAYIL